MDGHVLTCRYRRGRLACTECCVPLEPWCEYHAKGGKMVSPLLSFNLSTNEWSTVRPVGVGVVRCHGGATVQRRDNNTWRNLCQVCDKVARPLFCQSHQPGTTAAEPTLACRFFDDLSQELRVKVHHQHVDGLTGQSSGFEHRVAQFRVDGWVADATAPQVVEFLGDFWHGHPDRYADDQLHPVRQKTFKQVRAETFVRMELLAQQGYGVWWVWESHYRHWLESTPHGPLREQLQIYPASEAVARRAPWRRSDVVPC